jgi:glutaredoxin
VNATAPLNVYTVVWCPHCRYLLAWLAKEGIPFIDHDVEASEIAWKNALRLTGGVDIVPVVERHGQAAWGAFSERLRNDITALMSR